MRLFVYSKVPLLKISIINLLKNNNDVLLGGVELDIIDYSDDSKELLSKKGSLLIAVINSDEDLKNISEIKYKNNAKIIVIDFSNNNNIKRMLLDSGIDGYLTCTSEITDISLAIFQVNRGKKYYDGDICVGSKKNKFVNEKLTVRENEILELIALGKRNREIANSLYISENTVKKHVSNIFHKLNLSDRVEAMTYAYDVGIIS